MFAGIDIASERHVLARLGDAGEPVGEPLAFSEDRAGYDAALGPPPVLIAMEDTGHYWKNLFAVLTAAGHHVVLLNPLLARRFQEASLQRTKTDAIDARDLARLAFEKRPRPSRLRDEVGEALCELVTHRDPWPGLRRPRPPVAPPGDLGFPEFDRHVRSLDSMLATCLRAEHPTARDFAAADPRRRAKVRYDGRHFVGAELAGQLVEEAKRSVGQHHGPACKLQVRHICQGLDLWRRRRASIDRDIEGLIDAHEVGKLLATIEGLGPQSCARIIAAAGDPARFKSAAAFAAFVGVVPGLKQSNRARAPVAPVCNSGLRKALWMPMLGAARRNPWLRAFYERLRAAGKPARHGLWSP
jgi:transposase